MPVESVVNQRPERVTVVSIPVEVIRSDLSTVGQLVDTTVGTLGETVIAEVSESILDVLFRSSTVGRGEQHARCLPGFLSEQFEQFLVCVEQ